jgi:hypothetical protein
MVWHDRELTLECVDELHCSNLVSLLEEYLLLSRLESSKRQLANEPEYQQSI